MEKTQFSGLSFIHQTTHLQSKNYEGNERTYCINKLNEIQDRDEARYSVSGSAEFIGQGQQKEGHIDIGARIG